MSNKDIGQLPETVSASNDDFLAILQTSTNITKKIKKNVLVTSGGPTLQTNGVANATQTLLNLKQGTNITLTDDGVGGITIASIDPTGGGIWTVGPTGSGADYEVDGTADQVQINLASLAANTAGGGIVYLFPLTYIISDPVLAYPNVKLEGAGFKFTIVKAMNGYTPVTLNPEGGYSILLGSNNSTYATTTNSNFNINNITWDSNHQNVTPPDYANDRHRSIYLINTSDIWINHIKIINPIQWCTHFVHTVRAWIDHNEIYSGTEHHNATSASKQDGIHVTNSSYVWVLDNYIDTYGISSGSDRGSGDDSIVIQNFDVYGAIGYTNYATNHVYVERNTIRSGSRGILVNFHHLGLQDVNVRHNIIEVANNSGILLDKIVDSPYQDGVADDVVFEDNYIYNTCVTTSVVSPGGAAILYDPHSVSDLGFRNLKIINNTIDTVTNTATYGAYGIFLYGTGDGLEIIGNTIKNAAGFRNISLGNGVYAISNVTISDNTVKTTVTNAAGLALQGTVTGVVLGNRFYGSGNASAIRLIADNSPALPVTNIQIDDNYFQDWTSGIVEENNGQAPDNNTFSNNTFNNVTTRYTILGTNTKVIGDDGTNFIVNKTLAPLTNDGAALGTTSLKWSDLFLASGAVVNFNSGNMTITHSAGALAVAGGNMSITGALGVGVTPPSAQLHVVGDASNIYVGSMYMMDSTALAAGVGARIALGGVYTGTTAQAFGTIAGLKENGTNANFAGVLAFSTRPDGGAMTENMRISALGNIVLGSQAILATSATDGFVYMPRGAGTPSGVPTSYTGKVAFYYDSTNNIIYIYNGAWKKTVALT